MSKSWTGVSLFVNSDKNSGELESIYEKGIIALQILFIAKPTETDPKSALVSHLLAIDSKGNPDITRKALNDWYLAEAKNHKEFASKYFLNGEAGEQRDKIRAIHEWCKAEQISHTPAIYINGYELPNEYSVEDLNMICT